MLNFFEENLTNRGHQTECHTENQTIEEIKEFAMPHKKQTSEITITAICKKNN